MKDVLAVTPTDAPVRPRIKQNYDAIWRRIDANPGTWFEVECRDWTSARRLADAARNRCNYRSVCLEYRQRDTVVALRIAIP